MDAKNKELTYAIHITDGEFGRDIEVEADADGLNVDGGIIPWEWILSSRDKVQLQAVSALAQSHAPGTVCREP